MQLLEREDTRSLISGYEVYLQGEGLQAWDDPQAPAISPAILSFIAISSAGCGAAVSIISASVTTTIVNGC